MATSVLNSIKIGVKLDDGTDSSGNSKYVTVNMNGLSTGNYNADKVLSIVDNLEPCLSKSVAKVQETRVNTITGV